MEESIYLGVIPTTYKFSVKDPMSALTHFIGFWMSLIGMPILLIRASYYGADMKELISFSVFVISMVLLYGASTSYHTFRVSDHAEEILKKIDHMMIFVLIAGSYTPVCLIALNNTTGIWLLALVWGIALVGMAFNILWIHCPKWVSSIIYISMGWAALLAFGKIYHALPLAAFIWLLAGGILYTIGGVIYALKLPILAKISKSFGAHEVFHVFVMLGSFCHYMMMFLYLTQM